MAQDFYAAFNVGTNERHIAPIDESGVALAAIQGLNEKLEETRAGERGVESAAGKAGTIPHREKRRRKLKTRTLKLAEGGCQARSVLECGDWRGTGLAPLWNEPGARINPARVKAACALVPHPPHSKTWRMFGVLLTFFAITISVRAQSYSIDWYKISGGGGTSTGGVYSVSGTIGQPDASGEP